MIDVNIKALEVHPRNLEIYGEPDEGLAKSIGEHGIQTRLSIDRENRILSGARRWAGAERGKPMSVSEWLRSLVLEKLKEN